MQYYFAVQNFSLGTSKIVTKVDQAKPRTQPIRCSRKSNSRVIGAAMILSLPKCVEIWAGTRQNDSARSRRSGLTEGKHKWAKIRNLAAFDWLIPMIARKTAAPYSLPRASEEKAEPPMKRAPETKWRDSPAYGPRFFLSMLVALVTFAIITYVSTGSLATTAIQTIICAVLIQIGYFIALLFLTWRTAKTLKAEMDGGTRGKAGLDKPQPQVPVSMNEPGHSQS
jgi:exopolysaccharide production repressor protein